MSDEVVLLLGSNMGDRVRHLNEGVKALSGGMDVGTVSRIYASEPYGVESQPWFLNLALPGRTTLAPLELLRFVKSIEVAAGRTDGVRWGPRPLDIDIILTGMRVVDEPALTIPHVSMAKRRFCLVPIADILPDAVVPGDGRTVKELLQFCPDQLEVIPYEIS